MGFGEHPHDNMEIISIPLSGALEHRDSMGNRTVIRRGDIQVMSAGTGVRHSEYNHSPTEPVEFLQIWVFPDTRNVPPRYDQVTLDEQDRRNRLQQIVSPDPDAEGVWIHQSAWFHLGSFDKGIESNYELHHSGNGVYAFVIRGDFDVNDTRLSERDGAGITETNSISLKSLSDDAEILLMEVPML
jgi:redox-sensitive bicupin YhaK (pirin superfamily)